MRGSRLTGRGLGFLAAGIAAVALGMVGGQPDLVWPGLFLAFVPLLCFVAIVVSHPRFSVTRTLVPAVVAVDDPVRIDLATTTVPRLGTADVVATDAIPRSIGAEHRFVVPTAHRGHTVVESYVRQPRRRGRYVLDGFRYDVSDVFGMARRGASAPSAGMLVVTPQVVPLPSGRSQAFGRQGETPIPQTAISGPDDVLVREYQPRDDVRRIHWRSTARAGTLMVRREEQAWDPTAWIILDSRAMVHPMKGDVSPGFEWLLVLAASIGSALLTDGFEVSLTDAQATTFTASSTRDPGARTRLLEYLVDADRADEGSLRGAARAVTQSPAGHLVVALLGHLDAETARHLVATHDTRQECRAIVLPQPAAERAYEAGRAILVDHGWSVATSEIGGPVAPVWASVGAAR